MVFFFNIKNINNVNGKYTLTALAKITVVITIIIGHIKIVKSISICDKINHIRIKTRELATKAKNSQKDSICFSTFGLILYLQ